MLGRFLRLDAVELGSDSGRLRGKLHSRQTPPDAKDYLFAAVFGRVEWRGRISQALPVKKGEVLGDVDGSLLNLALGFHLGREQFQIRQQAKKFRRRS